MKRLNSERGVVMVIAALMITGLLVVTALVIDVGRLYLTRAQLQSAADAAALPGAIVLIENHQDAAMATQTAARYAAANLQAQDGFFPVVNPNNSTNTFQVTVSRVVNFYFAPIIGLSSQTVTATATAVANTVISVRNIVPFGVVQQEFEFGEQYYLKYGSKNSGRPHGSNYGALALGGNGARCYRDNIKYGYKEVIHVNDIISTEPGNMAGPTDQGVSYRKALDTGGCNFQTQIEANCPRVVITPVIDALPSGGRDDVTVVGFAAFFLEDTQDGEKGQKDVIGRFLKWTSVGDGGEGANFGLNTARLIK